MKYPDDFINQIITGDCLEAMKLIPDKSIDLVLTDPPYGLGYDKQASVRGGQQYGNAAAPKKHYDLTDWDKLPSREYFNEIIRVSKNQIIFGGEHLCLMLPKSRGWIVWDKHTGENNFSDCELAWTSYDKPIKKYDWIWNGMIQQNMKEKEERYHPTQKPLGLFKKILFDYVKDDALVLDCFLGSGTTAVACKELDRRFIGIEKEPKYVAIAKERLRILDMQPRLL